MNLIQRRCKMKTTLLTLVLLLLPAVVFAGDTCASVGGVCESSCRPDEVKQEGIYPDCYKQYCCTPKGNQPVPKEQPAKMKEEPAQTEGAAKVPAKPAAEEGSGAATTRKSPEALGSIIVCSPLEDTFARPESPLQCGDRETTLKKLYEENYRLIQIIPEKKALYYLEKKGAVE
jgi:hypothetical protein